MKTLHKLCFMIQFYYLNALKNICSNAHKLMSSILWQLLKWQLELQEPESQQQIRLHI